MRIGWGGYYPCRAGILLRPTILLPYHPGGDTVLVMPGEYYEEVDFLGKAITVRGDGAAATIDGGGGFAVVTMSDEGILQNFVITNGTLEILCFDGTPKVNQVTVVYNTLGLMVLGAGSPQI